MRPRRSSKGTFATATILAFPPPSPSPLPSSLPRCGPNCHSATSPHRPHPSAAAAPCPTPRGEVASARASVLKAIRSSPHRFCRSGVLHGFDQSFETQELPMQGPATNRASPDVPRHSHWEVDGSHSVSCRVASAYRGAYAGDSTQVADLGRIQSDPPSSMVDEGRRCCPPQPNRSRSLQA